ncbi:MAG: transglycosylase domain-containing protein, partial [Deltaproteobacteria bacterium]|nr:transglycosylase domain-containing protein [Deltaproteobacteria bacterium]
MGTEPPKRPARGRARTALRVLALALLSGLLLASLGAALVVHHFGQGLPRVETLRTGYRPPQVTRVLARDGVVLADLFTERRTVVPFEEIPVATRLAFLAAEDASFYEHEGLDYLGMLRALVVNLRAGETRQGGSTITQQVVKNVLLDPERTLSRKIRETLLARELEQTLGKDEIFALYLNHIYLGHGRYGVEEAARHYFGKKAAALDLAESALLAGIVAAPERLSPRKSPERALDRRRHVLAQMLAKGFITPPLHEAAAAAKLRIAPTEETDAGLCPEAV